MDRKSSPLVRDQGTEDDKDATTIRQFLAQQLTKEQPKSEKAPPGLDNALETSLDDVGRIFAAVGFWPWYAYFVAVASEGDFSDLLSGTQTTSETGQQHPVPIHPWPETTR